MLNAVNAELRDRWQLERRLAGGWNEGAYLLCRPDGPRAVLKWRPSDPQRLLGARERVEVARARGWPAPAWLAAGRGPAGGAWVLQEFIDGQPPPQLNDTVAEQIIEILDLQASLFPGATGGWGQWASGVVFEDWDGLRDRVRSGVPGGPQIVAAVNAIARTCSPEPLSSHDLVHGNFNLTNTIATPGRLWVVDVEGLGVGPRAYDLAEALLVAAEFGNVSQSAAARLRAYGAGLDRREFAICAGSIGLTMADAFIRHRRLDQAAGAVPRIVRTLERVLALAGA
jgi:aminoglycoside phosphotransferase (APT) family kinase protein